MRQITIPPKQRRQARARMRMVEHHEQVSRKVSRTCRLFGISRSQF